LECSLRVSCLCSTHVQAAPRGTSDTRLQGNPAVRSPGLVDIAVDRDNSDEQVTWFNVRRNGDLGEVTGVLTSGRATKLQSHRHASPLKSSHTSPTFGR